MIAVCDQTAASFFAIQYQTAALRFRPIWLSFIDDSVKNLREIDEYFNKEEKTISLIFATWGYTGPDDALTAEEFGYQVVTIDAFAEKLKAILLQAIFFPER